SAFAGSVITSGPSAHARGTRTNAPIPPAAATYGLAAKNLRNARRANKECWLSMCADSTSDWRICERIRAMEARWNNPRMRYLTAFFLICLVAAFLAAQSPSQTLAPTGTLRAIFLGGNPVQGRVDPKTGEATGPVPDLVRELARRLGVPYNIISAPDAHVIFDALKDHTADIGFPAYHPARAREADFGAAF